MIRIAISCSSGDRLSRQKPGCAMALNWCFNEPWPSAAGPCLVNWPSQPKPAYHAVRLA